MLFEIFLILVILGVISVMFPPLGAVIIQILSMPVKIVLADIRISGPLIAALIILYALGIIKV